MARYSWPALIRRYARQYGVDPQAALAVARMEGLSGGVGDQGTSFGPFQLHVGGALPRGKDRAWAESPAGIEYAISRMAAAGARGLKGQAAVNAIVRNFERPANPDKEVRGAIGAYGGTSAASSMGAGSTPLEASVAGGVAAPAPAFTKEDVALEGLTALAKGTYSPVAGLKALQKAAQATAAAASQSNPGAFNAGFNAFPIVSEKGGKLEQNAASLVQHYLGTKYVWGGASPQGFDCSGLIQWVWAHFGVKLPRTTQAQWQAGKPVQGALRPGDALFFGSSHGPGHVGMYIGGGLFVESPHAGAVVRISKLRGRSDYAGARRFA